MREGASSGSNMNPEGGFSAQEAPSEPLRGLNAGPHATRKLTSVQRFGPQDSMLVNKRPAKRSGADFRTAALEHPPARSDSKFFLGSAAVGAALSSPPTPRSGVREGLANEP